LLRSYSLTNLEADTPYRICLTLKDPEAKTGYVQLSCTSVRTKAALSTTVRPVPQTKSHMSLAVGLSVALLLSSVVYFAAIALKRYRRQRQYEIPSQKLTVTHNPRPLSDQNLAPIPLENIYSPLIKHMRH